MTWFQHFGSFFLIESRLLSAVRLTIVTLVEIAQLAPVSDLDGIETRLRDGSSVVVSKRGLEPLLVDAADSLSRRASTILFLCSSSFPVLDRFSGIIKPNELILPIMRHAAVGQVLGVIGPESDLPRQPEYWHPHVPLATFAAGSPSDSTTELVETGMRLVDDGATMLFLDCMGFREDQRTAIRLATGVPVFAATTLIGRLLPEFI